jgi:hypothetical protein
VLLAADGPRVIDFGISRALAGATVTASRVIMGTPGFMSPEQAQGLTVRFPSDVFALGCVIAFAATGAAPFGSGDMVAMAYRIVHSRPDLSGMPVALRNLMASCLAKAPADRPPLGMLLEAVTAAAAVYPAVSPTRFWPEPVAGLISSRQDSFRTQVSPRGDIGAAAAMPSPPRRPAASAWSEPGDDDIEAGRTATSLPALRGNLLIDRPEAPAGGSILGEPGSVRPAETSTINRVPRTEAEQEQLLFERPIGWEYLYFAARLLYERNMVEDKYRDYLMGYAPPTGEAVSRQDAPAYLVRASQDANRLVQDATDFMNSGAQEKAFGPPGVEGDPGAIERYVQRINGLYVGLIDWTAELRGASMPSEYGRAVGLLARVNDNAISEYRKFVDDVVAHNDQFPAQVAAGKVRSRSFSLRLTMAQDIVDAYSAELRRLHGVAEVGEWQAEDQTPEKSAIKLRYLAVMQVGDRMFELGRYYARALAIGACEGRPDWREAEWLDVNDTEAVASFRRPDGTEVTFAVLDERRKA